ncbi:YchK [Dehalogenimonas sp. WBC-2]|nr:YchK [Dehalogenimonas sp. WBC-2]
MKLGLALSGGAARALAHIGVIEVLEREGIGIDMVTGTSMGAIVGAAFARGVPVEDIKAEALDLTWRSLLPLVDLNPFQTSGIIGARNIRKKLKSIIGDLDFKELKMPFACVATDLISGEEVVFKSGSVLDAVLASMSLPLVFKVPRVGRRYLVDGGISDPLPVVPLKELGADKIIAVNVLKNLGIDTSKKKSGQRKKAPNFLQVANQVIYIASAHLAEVGVKAADVAIEPDMGGIHLADFNMAAEAIQCGEKCAVDMLPQIRALLQR